MFIRLSWLANHLKQDKVKLKKSDKASKKENDCNVSQVSLDVNPVPVMYIFGVFRQFLLFSTPKGHHRPLDPGFRGVTKGTKNRFGTVFSYFRGLQSLILGVFGVFRQFLAIFDPQRSPSALLTLGLGGSQK